MTSKADILKAIRAKCLNCSNDQEHEVRLCPVKACELYPYRFATDPNRSKNRGFGARKNTNTPVDKP